MRRRLLLALVLLAALPCWATTVTLTPTKDNFIQSNAPTNNNGASIYLTVASYGPSEIHRTLITFDASSIPSGATITSAIFSWWWSELDTTGDNPQGKTLWCYKLTRNDWSQGNTTNGIDSSWNTYKTSNSWTTAGGDYVTSSPAGGSTVIPTWTGTAQWITVDVTAIVADAVSTNSGLVNMLLRLATENDNKYLFGRSREDVSAKRPTLAITYTSGAATAVPNSLLMMGSGQ